MSGPFLPFRFPRANPVPQNRLPFFEKRILRRDVRVFRGVFRFPYGRFALEGGGFSGRTRSPSRSWGRLGRQPKRPVFERGRKRDIKALRILFGHVFQARFVFFDVFRFPRENCPRTSRRCRNGPAVLRGFSRTHLRRPRIRLGCQRHSGRIGIPCGRFFLIAVFVRRGA